MERNVSTVTGVTDQQGRTWLPTVLGVLAVAAIAGGAWLFLVNSEQAAIEVVDHRKAANAIAAIATLRNIISAQAQFQQSGKIDEDNDGTGEYGGFKDLSGGPMPRAAGAELVPPVLSSTYKRLSPAGFFQRSGYLYRIFLPRTGGVGQREPEDGFLPGVIDVDLCETAWCAYAHPIGPQHGGRTFFVNQDGGVTETKARGFGVDAAPAPDAGFVAGADMRGAFAEGVPGNEGGVWVAVN